MLDILAVLKLLILFDGESVYRIILTLDIRNNFYLKTKPFLHESFGVSCFFAGNCSGASESCHVLLVPVNERNVV